MKKCPDCCEEMDGETCRWCEPKKRFVEFAKSCGLRMFPDPSGERYLEPVDDKDSSCKKSEYPEFIDHLWNALVRARGGGEDLLI